MTATGLSSHDGSCRLAGFGSFLGEPLDLHFLGIACHSPESQV